MYWFTNTSCDSKKHYERISFFVALKECHKERDTFALPKARKAKLIVYVDTFFDSDDTPSQAGFVLPSIDESLEHVNVLHSYKPFVAKAFSNKYARAFMF